jgi:hypothetical protein
MIYRLVEADEVIARLDNDFNVNTGDWISRVPQWIYQCLSDLNIRLGLIPKAHISEVNNYMAEIPDDLEQLIGIEHNGSRLDRRSTSMYKESTIKSQPEFATIKTNVGVTIHGKLNNVTLDDSLEDIIISVDKIRIYDASTINELPLSNQYYYLIPNGKIETSFEDGLVTFHYYTFPSSYNERINSLCPLIPDKDAIKDAIVWYLFQSILQRGGKHPVFTLGSPNWKLDPFERYRKARLNAKNKGNMVDADQAKILDRMWRSHLYNVISKER